MSTEIIEQPSERASSLALITDDGNMARVMKMAEMMAASKVTVPKHLQGSAGDCAAIVIQATNWGMNPFAVAQKTHLVNGVLGYEAQLVNAVIQSSNAIKGNFSYEYQGEGAAMSCRVGAILNGQAEITWGEWLKSCDVTVKNSPLWKTNPKQQIGYLQVKNWARLYCPGAILGVYTAEELEESPPIERDITSQGSTITTEPKAKEYVADADFSGSKEKFKSAVVDGKRTKEGLIVWIESKGKLLTDAQKSEINSWTAKPIQDAELVEQPAPTSSPESTDDFLSDYENNEDK